MQKPSDAGREPAVLYGPTDDLTALAAARMLACQELPGEPEARTCLMPLHAVLKLGPLTESNASVVFEMVEVEQMRAACVNTGALRTGAGAQDQGPGGPAGAADRGPKQPGGRPAARSPEGRRCSGCRGLLAAREGGAAHKSGAVAPSPSHELPLPCSN